MVDDLGIIYIIVIRDTYEQYVGQSSRNDPNERMREHLNNDQLVDRKMRKHGYDAYVIEECENDLLDEREIYYIDQFNTICDYNVGGLNLTEGGYGMKLTPEVIKRRARTLRKTVNTPEHKAKMSRILRDTYKDHPEYGVAKGISMKEVWKKGDYLIKMKRRGEHVSNLWKTEDYRSRMEQSRKRYLESHPEYTEKKSEEMKKRWEDPEYRRKIVETNNEPVRKWLHDKAVREAQDSPEFKERNFKQIVMLDLVNGSLLNAFMSVGDAMEYLGNIGSPTGISHCCMGDKNSAFGYDWMYLDEYIFKDSYKVLRRAEPIIIDGLEKKTQQTLMEDW